MDRIFSFHFVSWIEAQRTLREGIVYPHWASGPNFGAGEPRFVFYPPLTWMAGSFLGLIFPWRLVSIVLVYLLLAATGFATLSGSAPPCTSNFVQMVNQSEHKIFMGSANRPGYLILHLRSYPAWRVTVNGRAADAAREGGYGLIAVPIAKGPALVVVDWTTTPDVWTGRGISVLTLVLLIALCVVERKGLRHPEVDGDSRKIKDSALITASRK